MVVAQLHLGVLVAEQPRRQTATTSGISLRHNTPKYTFANPQRHLDCGYDGSHACRVPRQELCDVRSQGSCRGTLQAWDPSRNLSFACNTAPHAETYFCKSATPEESQQYIGSRQGSSQAPCLCAPTQRWNSNCKRQLLLTSRQWSHTFANPQRQTWTLRICKSMSLD